MFSKNEQIAMDVMKYINKICGCYSVMGVYNNEIELVVSMVNGVDNLDPAYDFLFDNAYRITTDKTIPKRVETTFYIKLKKICDIYKTSQKVLKGK